MIYLNKNIFKNNYHYYFIFIPNFKNNFIKLIYVYNFFLSVFSLFLNFNTFSLSFFFLFYFKFYKGY